VSAMANAWVTYWSTSSMAAPESAAARRNLKISCTTSGASPGVVRRRGSTEVAERTPGVVADDDECL